jgi:hypothetical protein
MDRIKRHFTRMSSVAIFMAAATAGLAQQTEPSAGIPDVRFAGTGIGAKFGEPLQTATPWRVGHGKADRLDRLYQPGETVELAIPITNPTDQPMVLQGTWRWVWLGDAAGDDKGGVRYVHLGEHGQQPLDSATLGPKGEQVVRFSFPAPERRGVLGLFLDASDGATSASTWVTNVAVVFPVAPGARPDSPFFGDLRGVRDWQRAIELPVLRKLGVKWVRVGENWGSIEPKPGEFKWQKLDREIQLVRDNGMLAIYLGGNGGDWTRAYGKLSWPRDNPKKSSDSPSPSRYGDWSRFWEELAKRHPDVIRAINVFNEPWEAGGISNWGGTGAHYRDLQRLAHLGVSRAKVNIPVGGNDSDNNIVDNLFCDPSWRSYTELLTVHGGEFASQFVHRLAPDVPVWNTEHWYTAQTDRTVQFQVFGMLSGRSKINIPILGNFFTAGYQSGGYYNPKDEQSAPDLIPHPNVAGYNAMAHLVEGMKLVDELGADTLPYAALFERAETTTPEASHGALLVLIGTALEHDHQVWWQLHPQDDARMRLAGLDGITGVFDRYGRAIEREADGSYGLPFSTEAVYITADSVGPLREIKQRLTVTQHTRPLQVGILDALSPGERTLQVKLTNPLPHALEATVKGAAAVKLPAGGTAVVEVPREAGARVAAVEITTPLGTFVHSEPVGVRQIRRFTPSLDANLDEWLAAGIEPLVVTGGGGETASAAAAMPWEKLSTEGEQNVGRWAMAYDDQHLYLYAEMRTPKRGGRPWDQSRSDWYELHPGGYAYKTAPRFPFQGESVQLALDVMENPEDAIYPAGDARQQRYPQFRTDYLFGFYETAQGQPQAWLFRRPGGPFRHRYPFSPMQAIDQQIAMGVALKVVRDEAAQTTRYEAAIPLALLPELKAGPGAMLQGADVKLTTNHWSGLYSAAGRGAAKRDQSVFQPYWMPGYTTNLPWRFE